MSNFVETYFEYTQIKMKRMKKIIVTIMLAVSALALTASPAKDKKIKML